MKIVILSDNEGNDILQGEWGMSALISYNGKNILLDTGASGLFAENAEKLKIDLASVDFGVLSHAHYDHSDGMEKFFEINKDASFYIRESTAENCYKKVLLLKKYIGIKKGTLDKYSNRIVSVSGDFELCPGVYLIPHKTENLSDIGKMEKMYQKSNNRWIYDNFSHEQSLVFKTGKGLVIFNSCSHGGAANIINEVSNTFPDDPVYAMIGGFHLFNKPENYVRDFASAIRATGIKYICTGHCTGDGAYDILAEELGDICHKMSVGLTFEL